MTFNDSMVKIRLDNSNQLVSSNLKKAILDSAYSAMKRLADKCGWSFSYGIDFKFPFSPEMSYGFCMIPGLVVVLHFLMAMALTADQLCSEREQGLLVRTFACGVPLWLNLICQLLAHFVVIVPQVHFHYV